MIIIYNIYVLLLILKNIVKLKLNIKSKSYYNS